MCSPVSPKARDPGSDQNRAHVETFCPTVKVHNEFWIEFKPKTGPADAFAPGANYNDKEFMARLKSLRQGDSVTIKYSTDFERHRIESLRKNKGSGSP